MGKWLKSDEVKRHDLGDGEYIEYKAELSYEEFAALFGKVNMSGSIADKLKLAKPLLKSVVTGWRLLDEEGNEIAFDKDVIDKLSLNAIMMFAEPIFADVLAEKKSSMPSKQQLKKGKVQEG